LKSSSIAKARGSITKIFHVPLENLRSDPRRTVPLVPGTDFGAVRDDHFKALGPGVNR
jgi:hypothetical protein